MTSTIKQAMVLAAGFGNRLRPLTLTTPKPLIQINGRPLLSCVFDKLVAAGVERIIINTHYLADQIHEFCNAYHKATIIISHEQDVLETGGGILNALNHFNNQPFFSVNADIWWQDNEKSIFEQLTAAWDDKTMEALLTLVPKQQALYYDGPGDYNLTTSGAIVHRQNANQASYIYGGIQLLAPSLFDSVSPGPQSIVPLYHQAERKQRLFGQIFSGTWCDIGTLKALSCLETYLAS